MLFLGKGGLGRKDFLMRKKVERNTQEVSRYSDFRQRKQLERLQAHVFSDLKRSKMACHQLDSKKGLMNPEVEWYWPEELLSSDQETEDRQSSTELPDSSAVQQHCGESHASPEEIHSCSVDELISKRDYLEEILGPSEKRRSSCEDQLDFDETEDVPEVQENSTFSCCCFFYFE